MITQKRNNRLFDNNHNLNVILQSYHHTSLIYPYLHLGHECCDYGHLLGIDSCNFNFSLLFNVLQVNNTLLHLPQTTHMGRGSQTNLNMKKDTLQYVRVFLFRTEGQRIKGVVCLTYLSCLVLIFCSSCLLLPFSSESCFFSASNSLSWRSSAVASFCRTFIRSSISRNLVSQAWSQGVNSSTLTS